MYVPDPLFVVTQLIERTVLKQTIRGEGVWRIRRRDRSPVIEVRKYEESGTGSILSDEFLNWRSQTFPNGATTEQETK